MCSEAGASEQAILLFTKLSFESPFADNFPKLIDRNLLRIIRDKQQILHVDRFGIPVPFVFDFHTVKP